MTDFRPLRGALLVSSEVSGGGEQYLYRLYSGLRDQFSVQSTLIGHLPDWHSSLGENLDIGPSSKFTRRQSTVKQVASSVRPLRVTRKLANSGHFDFVHFQYLKEKLTLPRFVKAPVRLWTEHGPLPTNLPAIGFPILREQARHCTVIAVSPGVKESLASHGIDSIVIPNPLPDTPNRLPPLSDGVNTALFAGRLHPFKRIDLLITALGRLPNWRILIAGEGPDEQRLRELAPDNVEFLGRLKSIEGLLDTVSVVVITSGRAAREGSPMIMLEARAKGVPTIVATDCHAAGEAAQLGCGLFEPDPDALEASAVVAAAQAVLPLSSEIRDNRATGRWLTAHWELATSVLNT